MRHLAEMPLPTTLVLRVHGLEAAGGRVLLTTSRDHYADGVDAGEVVFSPVEYEALCAAAEADRVRRSDFASWCRRKAHEPGWRLSQAVAFGGMGRPVEVREMWWAGDPERGIAAHRLRHGWTFGRLLSAVGAELEGVEIEAQGEAA